MSTEFLQIGKHLACPLSISVDVSLLIHRGFLYILRQLTSDALSTISKYVTLLDGPGQSPRPSFAPIHFPPPLEAKLGDLTAICDTTICINSDGC